MRLQLLRDLLTTTLIFAVVIGAKVRQILSGQPDNACPL
jgi:hypothetical protein